MLLLILTNMLSKLLRQSKVKNLSKSTILSTKRTLEEIEKSIGKPLQDATPDDILDYIEKINESELAKSTISLYEKKLLQFYRFCFDKTDDVKYNKLIRQIKSIEIKNKEAHISPSDILLPEDIKKLINVATLERDRCIISTLFESGMRMGELLALTNAMVIMDDTNQRITFNIPDQEGCKTGGRTVVCTDIHGYVQDWMKCNTSDKFIPLSRSGLSKTIDTLFNKAGITKPSNPHNFRHSAITHSVNIGMQTNAISKRFWGIPNSNMLATYVYLSEQMQADAYLNAKGLNGDSVKVINPIACRCVECGKLIEKGNLCKQCKENADLKLQLAKLENTHQEIVNQQNQKIEFILGMLDGTVNHFTDEMKQKLKGKKA
jgi:integrase/recombinase XerD